MKYTYKKVVLMSAFALIGLTLSGCGKKEVEPTPEEIQYEQNVSFAPEQSTEVKQLIEESRGTLLLDDEGNPLLDEEGNPTGEVGGSLSPGFEKEVQYSTLTQEQLMKLDKEEQIDIFVNGVLRDEYAVAANVLYGKDEVKQLKAEILEAFLSPATKEVEKDGMVADLLSKKSMMNDADVGRHFAEEMIQQLNRVYIETSLSKDFTEKVIVQGSVYPLEAKAEMNALAKYAHEFVEFESAEAYRTDEQKAALNKYYRDSYLDALKGAKTNSSAQTLELSGFEKDANGTWVPSDMNRFTLSLIELVFNR